MMQPIQNVTPVQTSVQVPGAAGCCKAISLTRNAVHQIARISFIPLGASIGWTIAVILMRQNYRSANSSDAHVNHVGMDVALVMSLFQCSLAAALTYAFISLEERPQPSQPFGRAVAPIDNVPIHNAPIHNAPIHNVPIHNVPIHNAPIDNPVIGDVVAIHVPAMDDAVSEGSLEGDIELTERNHTYTA